ERAAGGQRRLVRVGRGRVAEVGELPGAVLPIDEQLAEGGPQQGALPEGEVAAAGRVLPVVPAGAPLRVAVAGRLDVVALQVAARLEDGRQGGQIPPLDPQRAGADVAVGRVAQFDAERAAVDDELPQRGEEDAAVLETAVRGVTGKLLLLID